MPGIAFHVLFAQKVISKLTIGVHVKVTPEYSNKFIQGNLIVDMFDREKKRLTHQYIKYVEGFEVPDMKAVYEMLKENLNNPVVLGIYSHLYLDDKYIKGILVPSFVWNEKTIKNPLTGYEVSTKDFWKDKSYGIYGAYTSMNPMLIGDSHLDLDSIPSNLSMSGIKLFDEGRRKQTWREELDEYLAESSNFPYTGLVLNYEEMISKLDMYAEEFVNHLKDIRVVVQNFQGEYLLMPSKAS